MYLIYLEVLQHASESYRNNRVCCLFLIDGFVSNECGLFLFFPVAIAAAAATPMGPAKDQIGIKMGIVRSVVLYLSGVIL